MAEADGTVVKKFRWLDVTCVDFVWRELDIGTWMPVEGNVFHAIGTCGDESQSGPGCFSGDEVGSVHIVLLQRFAQEITECICTHFPDKSSVYTEFG